MNDKDKRGKIMRNFISNIIKNISSTRGASLAEFATTTALMATLAATASPKLSEMAESGKSQKTIDNIDKIIQQGQQFYQDTADSEGRGRFPGQGKFDMVVGGANHGTREDYATNGYPVLQEQEFWDIEFALFGYWDWDTDDWSGGAFSHFESPLAQGWLSVFGLMYHEDPNAGLDAYDGGSFGNENNLENRRPANHQLHVDDEPDMNNSNCSNCERNASYSASGHTEWLTLFGNEVINSPFQDGHYIYRVVPGYGSGDNTVPPILYVADLENPANYHQIIQP